MAKRHGGFNSGLWQRSLSCRFVRMQARYPVRLILSTTTSKHHKRVEGPPSPPRTLPTHSDYFDGNNNTIAIGDGTDGIDTDGSNSNQTGEGYCHTLRENFHHHHPQQH